MDDGEHTRIFTDRQDAIDALPVEAGTFRAGRVFKGGGVTLIRLSFAAGAVMREHQATAPILVQTLSGHIVFEVSGESYEMPAGAIIHVEANVPHELTALEDSHVLLAMLR